MKDTFELHVTNRVKKELQKLSRAIYTKIEKAIDGLLENPYPAGVKKLNNHRGLYRIRIGDYRVIYQIENKKLIIVVIKVAHRKDVYKGL